MRQHTVRKLVQFTVIVVGTLLLGRVTAADNKITVPGFETDGGWQVELRDGSEGGGERDETVTRSGNYAMRLHKTNGLGHVVLRSADPIRVKAGTKYTFRGYFHSKDAPLGTALLFRVTPEGRPLAYDSIDRTAGWSAHSFLINAPEGRWEKRVVTYRPAEDGEVYLHVVLYGNPATVWLDDLEFTAEPYKVPHNLGEELQKPYTREQVMEVLADRESVTTQMTVRDGRTMLLMNDQVVPPVLYKALQPAKADYHGMSQAGIDFTTVVVRIGGQRDVDGPWRGAGEYDFEGAEEVLVEALQKNPHAVLVLDLWIYPYVTWGLENLDEVWVNDKGEYAHGWWGNLEGFTDDPTLAKVNTPQRRHWLYPSYQSDKWRQDAGEAVAAMIEHLRHTPMWKAVGGVFITGGHDGQFVTMFNNYDYSPTTLRKFRTWLKDRYSSIEQANAAWGESYASFEAIQIPQRVSTNAALERGTPYLPPGLELDYRMFMDAQAWDLKDHFAGIAKSAADKPIVALAYYGSPILRNFLRTQHLDAAGGMSYYPYRLPGYPIGYPTENAFSLHGKMFIQEIDLRSWVGALYDEVLQRWIGAGDTPERWNAIARKLVGMSLANDYGHWYYDMHYYYNDPQIIDRIAKTQDITKSYWSKPVADHRPDVAIIITEDSEMYHRPNFSAVKQGMRWQRMLLETSGVPYHVHYLEDVLEQPALQDYKVYVFLLTNHITTEQREQINTLLKNRNRTLAWIYDTGYISEAGHSVEALSQLVGMTVRTEERFGRRTAMTVSASDPLLAGVQPTLGMSELVVAIMNIKGANSFIARYQPFWIEDPAATPLAHYAETEQVAIAYKDFDDWRSIYFAAPNSLGNQLLHNIAEAAGAYVAGDAGQSLFMNDRFASVHGLRSGPYTLRLPAGRSRVVDPDTGEVLADGVEAYTFEIEAQQTYWFFLE